MEIRKKTWPEMFQKVLDGEKTADIRLADFDIKEGDILILEEWDPQKKEYTGRKLQRTVKNLNKVFLTDFHSPEQMKRHGHWVIEF
ncbi:MAG: DUF3850 domain-containing protein [Candidatus Aenigmatarchaeota archaeon]